MNEYGKIVNIFIVAETEASLKIYSNICHMLKGVQIYGFISMRDTLKFSLSLPPDLVIVSCKHHNKNSIYESVTQAIAIDCKPIVVAIGLCDNYETEAMLMRAGVLSCLSEPMNPDKLFFLVKNITDIIKEKHISSNSPHLGVPAEHYKPTFYFRIITVKGYGEIIAMNRNIGRMPFIKQFSGNLIFIRFLSFLYDFFVKIFWADKAFIAGIFADDKRIILEFPKSEDILNIAKNAVFYSVAKKYSYQDGEFVGFNLSLTGHEFTMPKIESYSIFSSISNASVSLKFGQIFDGENLVEKEVLAKLSRTVSRYSIICPIFEYFQNFLGEKASVLHLVGKKELLEPLFDHLDIIIYELAEGDAHGLMRQNTEDRLILILMKIMLIIG